jgi:hypothetical protein
MESFAPAETRQLFLVQARASSIMTIVVSGFSLQLLTIQKLPQWNYLQYPLSDFHLFLHILRNNYYLPGSWEATEK